MKAALAREVAAHGGGGRVSLVQGMRVLADECAGMAALPSRAWNSATLVNVASCSKLVTAVAVARLVDRGLLAYDAPVAAHWPAFAQAGKGALTLCQLLTHRGRLHFPPTASAFPVAALDAPVDTDSAAWREWLALLETMPLVPDAPEGACYHPLWCGFVLSALCFQVTGKSMGRFVADELAAPLGLTLHMGLPRDADDRVARVNMAPEVAPADRTAKSLFVLRAYTPLSGMTSFWSLRRCESPAHICWTESRSLAQLWSLFLAGQLCSAAVVASSLQVVVPEYHDVVLDARVAWTRGGFMHFGAVGGVPLVGHTGFGTGGGGGAVALWHQCSLFHPGGHFVAGDPTSAVAVAFATNAYLFDSAPRRARIIDAALQCWRTRTASAL